MLGVTCSGFGKIRLLDGSLFCPGVVQSIWTGDSTQKTKVKLKINVKIIFDQIYIL
jgi:hypothetical protein